jgi:hypothetical protein
MAYKTVELREREEERDEGGERVDAGGIGERATLRC